VGGLRFSFPNVEYFLMSYQLTGPDLAQLYAPALLFSETPREYELLRKALQQQIQPKNTIEHIWVADLVNGEHERWRLGQFRARIIRSKTPQALRNLLKLITDVSESDEIDYLASKWFTNKTVKRRVAKILRDFGSDETSIDAEAFLLSMTEIGMLDRREAELELRRDKILRQIEDRRAGLAIQVVTTLDQHREDDASALAGEDEY
jgi:hypothetical protein